MAKKWGHGIRKPPCWKRENTRHVSKFCLSSAYKSTDGVELKKVTRDSRLGKDVVFDVLFISPFVLHRDNGTSLSG